MISKRASNATRNGTNSGWTASKARKGRRKKLMTDSQLGIQPIMKFHFLPLEVPENNVRFVVSNIISQTDGAYLVTIKERNYWMPKQKVRVGYNKTGSLYIIDMPILFAKIKQLLI